MSSGELVRAQPPRLGHSSNRNATQGEIGEMWAICGRDVGQLWGAHIWRRRLRRVGRRLVRACMQAPGAALSLTGGGRSPSITRAIRRSSGGHREAIGRSSEGHQEVIRRSSGGHYEAIGRPSGGGREVVGGTTAPKP